MRQRALHLLARLERQELDRERQARSALEAQRAATAEALAGLRSRVPAEHAIGWEAAGGPGLLAGYLAEARRAEARLGKSLALLGSACERADAALRERLAGMKSLELAAERLASAQAAEEARRAQAAIEEASLSRRPWASGGGASVVSPSGQGCQQPCQDQAREPGRRDAP